MAKLLFNKNPLLIFTLTALLCACGGGSDNADITATTPETARKIKLLAPPNNGIYFSAFPDFGGDEEIVNAQRLDDFYALAEKKMAWASFSQPWFQGLEYPKVSIHTIHDKGIVPLIRLMPRSNHTEFQQENKYTLDKIIKGDFDKALKSWAQESKKDNIPLLIDFAVEMNGNWFGWSGALNGADKKDGYGDPKLYDGPEKYRDAYRHIIDLFRDEEVNHITWFFHPNIRSEPAEEWNSPRYYYPGDNYIDWIGISLYGPFHPGENYWDTFSDILKEQQQNILDISSTKPFCILEFGVTDHHPLGSKAEWLNDAFSTILEGKYIPFEGINYWHENWDNDGLLTSLRIDSSKETLNTFQGLIQNPRFISNGVFSKK